MISITKLPKYIYISKHLCIVARIRVERGTERKAINFQSQVPFALLTLVTEFASITQGGGLQKTPPLPKVSFSPSLTLTFRLSVNLITLVESVFIYGTFFRDAVKVFLGERQRCSTVACA